MKGPDSPALLALAAAALTLGLAIAWAEDKPLSKAQRTRTRAEVDALVAKVGKTPPEWWAKVTANPPKTLDLSWPQPAPPGPWDPARNVGQYIWSVINENPSRWKEGVKFMAVVMAANKNRPEVLARAADATARMYQNLLEDYARAAFWWKKAAELGGEADSDLEVADCYWELGSKAAASEILERIGGDGSRNGGVARLWADMGEYDRALKLAGEIAAEGRPDVGHLVEGDTYRVMGRYAQAIEAFQKVLDAKQGSRDLERNQKRAQESLQATRLFADLAAGKLAGGTYRASSLGYEAPVEVEVTVSRGKITDVRVTQHREKQFYSSLTDTPRRVIEKQGVNGVDATTGATITSEAILNATAKALSQGLKTSKRK